MTDPIPDLPQGVLLPPVPTISNKVKRDKKRTSGVKIPGQEEGSSQKKEYKYRPKQTYRPKTYNDSSVQMPIPIKLPGPNEDIVNYDRAVK